MLSLFSTYAGSCLDGEGIRFMVFFAGCNLRCQFCHNIDAVLAEGNRVNIDYLVRKTLRYKSYFGAKGGVTLSGGEPLLQEEGAAQYLTALKSHGINTAIETNGTILPTLTLDVTDTYIIDIKNQLLPLDGYAKIFEYLTQKGKRVTATNVVIPGVNEGTVSAVKNFALSFGCVKEFIPLPFSNICKEKYRQLGLDWRYD